MSDETQGDDDLRLIFYPAPQLRKKASPVEAIDDDVRAKIDAMVEILYEAQGIGLAATQVAWMTRVCLINPSGEVGKHYVMINPKILLDKGRVSGEEGCLSLPEIYAVVSRSENIVVRYQTLEGEEIDREVSGVEATVIQHEIDHLDGILFISKISPADRIRLKKKLRGLEAEYEEVEVQQERDRGRRAFRS